MADVCFQKPEVVISQPWIEISHRNLVVQIDLDIPNECAVSETGASDRNMIFAD